MEQAKTENVQDFLEKMAFQKVKRMLSDSGCVNTSGYRDEYLKRRFDVRLRATGANTYGRYIGYLQRHPDEFQKLMNDLTINFTSFFRDSDVYSYLQKSLLPKLLTSSQVKIWSAGCASGEEPYSLAILVHKVLGRAIDRHFVTIYASDIDRDALAFAGAGKYLQRHVNSLDAASIEKYFTRDGEGYLVKDCVKKLVHFERFDLMTTPLHCNLDLILCRNVMIYFSKEGQQRIHMGFYNALRSGGYFITGKSEILSGEPAQKFQTVDCQARVYQKPATTEERKLDIHIANWVTQTP